MADVLKKQPEMSAPAEEYAANALSDSLIRIASDPDSSGRMSRDVQREANTELDIAYGPHEDQALDVYLPDAPGIGPLPVLLFIHGGAWSHGYKEWMGFMAPAITRLPAIFIPVGYGLAPGTRFPGPVEDCRNAVKWVYENISQSGGDPEGIFVGGHSAGGHLAALITLQREKWGDTGLPETVIKGCFPVSGSYDLRLRDREFKLLNSSDEIEAASPVTYISGNTVPFYVAYGDNDFEDLQRQAPLFAKSLEREGCRVELEEFEDSDHFKISLDNGDVNGRWATTVRRWIHELR